jgi:hypothetical protein
MISKRILLVVICFFTFGIVSVTQAQTGDVLHIVMSVEGTAYISRYSDPGNLSDETLLTAGSFVKSSDVIDAGPGSRVVILCANRATDVISNELRSPNCSSNVSEPLVAWNNVEIYGQQRAATDETVYVLSPRNTMIMTAKPTIEWTPVANAEARGVTYRVTLYNTLDNSIVWQKDGITGSSMPYPEDEQPLPAVDPAEHPLHYQFVVTPVVNNQELRNFDPMRPEGFCIVSARHRPAVEKAVDELSNLTLPDGVPGDVKSFNLAVYYHGRRLYSDALNELMQILPVPLDQPFPADQVSAQSIVGSPSYYILLGNVLYAERLPLNQVEPAYTRASDIATTLDDTAALATINEQLADILRGRKPTITQDNDPQVYNYYESAIQYFQSLNDQTAVQRIEQKLDSQPTITTVDLCQP